MKAQQLDTLGSFITPDSVETHLGTLRFKDGVPDAATTQKLYDGFPIALLLLCCGDSDLNKL